MDLSWKIEICEALINLDIDTTIGEFSFVIDVATELEPPLTITDLLQIIHYVRNEKDSGMPSRKGTPNLTEQQKNLIIKMAADGVSVPMIARIMKVQTNAIYVTCAKAGGIETIRLSNIQKYAS